MDPRLIVRRGGLLVVGVALALSGCDRGPQVPEAGSSVRLGNAVATGKPGVPAPANGAPAPVAGEQTEVAGATPMAERVAVLGILNKRNGIARDLTIRPGQAIRVGEDLIVRLRACEMTPPWQFDRWTGAFVQVDVRQPDARWKRVFSGWLYKESPSLNVVEHPVYDVWPKSCAMTFPDAAVSADKAGMASRESSDDQSAGDPESASDSAAR